MARLRLISLESFHLEQWNDDVEPYLLVNGKYFWESGSDKESARVDFTGREVVEFSGQTMIEFKDGEGLSQDGQVMGVVEVKDTQAGKGEFEHFFRTHGMIYKLTYEVL